LYSTDASYSQILISGSNNDIDTATDETSNARRSLYFEVWPAINDGVNTVIFMIVSAHGE